MGSASRLALLVQLPFSLRRINNSSQLHLHEPPPSSAAEHGSFDANLVALAQQLQLQGGGAHLNWLLDACTCTLSTHSSLASLLSHSDAPPQSQHADMVLSLIDACTSLEQMADDMDHRIRRLQHMQQALKAPHISHAKVLAATHRLCAACQPENMHNNMNIKQKCKDQAHAALLLAAKRTEALIPAASHPVNPALDGTILITLLVLASTLSSFTEPSRSGSASRRICKLVTRYCSKSSRSSFRSATAWVGPLQQLQSDLRQEEMGAIFLELQGLQTSAASLLVTIRAQDSNVEVVRQGIDSLCKRSQEAQTCLSTLRSNLASLFQALLALRLALLH